MNGKIKRAWDKFCLAVVLFGGLFAAFQLLSNLFT